MLSLPPAGGTGKKVNGASLFGKERYDQYVAELSTHGTIEGILLTRKERLEGHQSRYSRIGFKRFVENIFAKKAGKNLVISAPRLLPQKEQLQLPQSDSDSPASRMSAAHDRQIGDQLDAILGEIAAGNKADREEAKEEDIDAENERRKKNEARKESIKNFLISPIRKALSPVTSFFDNFLGKIGELILSAALIKLIKWFGDKENQRKANALFRFVKDFWPGIVGGIIAIAGVLAGIALWATAGPLVTALATLGTISVAVAALGKKPDDVVDDSIDDVGKDETLDKLEDEQEKRSGFNWWTPWRFLTGERQEREEQIQRVGEGTNKRYGFFGESPRPAEMNEDDSAIKMNKGGQIPGSGNTDTVPAMLTPGEFVVSAPAVQKWGADTFASMNAMGGGTNRPYQGGFQGGGLVGNILIKALENKMTNIVSGPAAQELKNKAPDMILMMQKMAQESAPLKDKLPAILNMGLNQTFSPTIQRGGEMFDKALEGLNSPKMLQMINEVAPMIEEKGAQIVPIIERMGDQMGGGSVESPVSDGIDRVSSVDGGNTTLYIMNALYNLGGN